MTTITIDQVTTHLQTKTDFDRFFKIVAALGPQLNSEQFRFLKAHILEKSLEICADYSISYVANVGCDFLIPELNDTKLEMKFNHNSVFGKTGNLSKNCTAKLMNSNGSNKHAGLPEDYADFLLVVSQRGAVVFDKPTLSQYITVNGDGIKATIPTELGTVVAGPWMQEHTVNPVDFVDALNTAIYDYVIKIT
jgi:hypothetical protein